MAGVRISKPPSSRFVDSEKSRNKAAEPFVAQLPVRVHQQTRWPCDSTRMRANDGLHDCHHHRRRQPVSGGVANENAPSDRVARMGVMSLVQREQIVEVAAGAA